MDDWLDTAQLVCIKTDEKAKYDFNKFMFPSKFALKIYRHDFTLQEAEDDQQKLQILINKLNNSYNSKNKTKVEEKGDILKSTKQNCFLSGRKKLLERLREVFSVHRWILSGKRIR